MAFITTNPSPFIINIPELQNVLTSATGGTDLTTTLANLQALINTSDSSASVNSIGSANNGSITVKNDLNLSNASIQFQGLDLLTSNSINGTTAYLSLQVDSVEEARLTATGLGIATETPIMPLDVNGNALVRQTFYVSTFGAAPITPLGDIYADGDVYARGVLLVSDPVLKKDVVPYILGGELPDPVEFKWISNGERDIGVLATDVERLEPACVQRTPAGTLTVNYQKLVVLLLAEVKELKKQVRALKGE